MNFIEKKNVSFIPQADKIIIDPKSIRSILNRLKANKRRFQPATGFNILYRSNRSFNMSPRAYPGHLSFAVPGRREFDYKNFPGGGEFELHPRFHVKSLAWRAIMADAVLKIFMETIVPLWPIGYKERA